MQQPEVLIEQMFKIQFELNTKSYSTEWIAKGATEEFDYAMAAGDEAHEYARSLPFQWWTKDKADRSNQITEIVDAWHFVMSQKIIDMNGDVESAGLDAGLMYKSAMLDATWIPTEKQMVKTFVAAMYAHNNPLTGSVYLSYMKAFFMWMTRAGVDINLLYARYLAKATLNKFRVENGYKRGEYDKIWTIEGEKGEDNFFLARWVEQELEAGANPGEREVRGFLIAAYDMHKAQKEATE